MTQVPFDESLLEREVVELTTMLREEAVFLDVRQLLSQKGINAAVVMMAGLLEDSEGFESGVIISEQREVYLFTRNADTGSLDGWETIEDPATLMDTFPAVATAMKLVSGR